VIGDADEDEDVLHVGLRVLNGHVEIAAFVEHARVDQLVFRLVLAAALVFFNEIALRKC